MVRLVAWTLPLVLLTTTAFAQSLTVRWADQKLTVLAQNTPLQKVIEDVAAQTNVMVTGADRLTGPLSIELRDQPLTDALRQLLEHANYLITTRNGEIQVRIHSMTGTGRGLSAEKGPLHIPGLTDRIARDNNALDDPGIVEEIDEEQQEELDELEESATAKTGEGFAELIEGAESDNYVIRIRALQLLSARKEPGALEAILAALGDEDLDVSLSASDLLAEMPGDLVVKKLAAQFGSEIDPDAQFGALRALALRADLTTIPLLKRLVPDIHPLLREQAAMVLRKLEEREKVLAKTKQP